ncbi:MAG: hypothetical protein AUH79_07725 [Betaproteobacteria bacterium 13_1_40CM_4_64_4]|nr:MAG: hypothetical protein AUH79_07725 [Betaproteobacteria bacterium 13_1_40CM_4_64_4]
MTAPGFVDTNFLGERRQRCEAARVGEILLVLMLAGCGGVKSAPPGESPQTGSTQAVPAAVAPVAPAVTPPSPASLPSPPPASAPTVAAQGPIAAVEPAEQLNAPSTSAPPSQAAAKTGTPAAKANSKAPAAPPAAAQTPAKDVVAQNAATPKAAPLDLTSLETRLRETRAIGVMTKLALKNQVDDLLNQFRAFYAGKLKTTLAELRRPYDLLVLKVLSLLQDSDPSLAAAIVASREAIWGILSDRMKFAKFASA